jgi:TolB-like protein
MGKLWKTAREHISNAVVGGAILVLTGFTPETWMAKLLSVLHVPDSLRVAWPSFLDARVLVLAAGVAIIVGDTLLRQRKRGSLAPSLVTGVSPAVESGARTNPATAPVRDTLPLPDKPSIAVLPFTNLSGDAEQEYFADGITEDVITALSRFRWFFVIARNSSFVYKGKATDVKQVARELGVRYVLEGSVRKYGERVRITAQLIDGQTANHIWAERYDFDLAEIFSVQDEITERVTGAIEPEVLKLEGGRLATRAAANLNAWDLVRQGTWHFHQVTQAGHLRARELFREAIKLDPQFADSHIWLARVSAGIVAFGWSGNPQDDLREGLKAAQNAIRLDEKDPYSHYALAIISVFSDALEQATHAALEAVEISPSFALGYYVLGTARVYSGNAIEAIGSFERGFRLNPYDPQNFVFIQLMSIACYFAGQVEMALQTAVRAYKIRPDWRPTLETLIICYATLDKMEEAHRYVEQLRELENPTGDLLALLKAHNPQWSATIADMLRKGGWKE